MKRLLLSLVASAAMTGSAFASANIDCAAKDQNVTKLEIEAITSRDGKFLDSLRGELELEAGKAITLTKQDIKSYHSQKNIALTFAKRTPQGLLEIQIYAKPVGDGDLDYEGRYTVRLGKINKSGKVACTAG